MGRFSERMLFCTYFGVDEMVESVVDWGDNFTGMNNILESKSNALARRGAGPP